MERRARRHRHQRRLVEVRGPRLELARRHLEKNVSLFFFSPGGGDGGDDGPLFRLFLFYKKKQTTRREGRELDPILKSSFARERRALTSGKHAIQSHASVTHGTHDVATQRSARPPAARTRSFTSPTAARTRSFSFAPISARARNGLRTVCGISRFVFYAHRVW